VRVAIRHFRIVPKGDITPGVAVGTRVLSRAPRIDPYVRLSRIRLPPRVIGDKAISLLCAPERAPGTPFPGSVSGGGCARSRSPWSPPFAPPTPLRASPLRGVPQKALPLCSPASSLLWRGPTSRVRASSATAPRLPDAGRQRQRRSGQTRDLPGSDTILLQVMWPLTPAGGQHLA